jgi:pimeloyl-ACP methyl ester carboxylesterase
VLDLDSTESGALGEASALGRNPPGRIVAISYMCYAAASFPGVARAIVVTYYRRTGVYSGWDFVSVLPVASRIKCPVLIVSGERDFVVPTADARRILAALPGGRKRLVTIPNAFHDTTYDAAPVLYQEAVLGFLDGNFPKMR